MKHKKPKNRATWVISLAFHSLLIAIFGLLALFMCIGGLIYTFDEKTGEAGLLAVFWGLCFFYLLTTWALIRSVARVKRFKPYIELLVNQRMSSLEEVAREVGLKYRVVVKDMEFMILKKYLKDATIDHDRKTIVIPAVLEQQNMEANLQQTQHAAPNILRTIECHGCGANMIISGPTTCDFCNCKLS
jgi:hypothetical protein